MCEGGAGGKRWGGGRKITEANKERTSLPFSKEEGRHQMMGFRSGLLKGE
jgi:hypothetical protein